MSFLFLDEPELVVVLAEADRQYGPLDFVSEPLPFDFTDYYAGEMGKGLRRRIVSFRSLISPEELVDIKFWTNSLEARHLNEQGGRKVNIDPGYLAAARFVLATGKDYSHRIYLGKAIYGEVTLIFQNGAFTPLPWTYPDYASQPLLGLLTLIRKHYLWQMRNQRAEDSRGPGFKDKDFSLDPANP